MCGAGRGRMADVDTDRLALFEASRPRLFGLAYRMLGEAAEAEDVVQDACLRWAKSDDVAVPEAWLTKVVTNLCLNRLTTARARRETYIGPWLPEPVGTANGELGPLDTVERKDSVSFGVLVMLERLTPPERAVFILREAFGYTHREIAELLSIDERQLREYLQLVARENQRLSQLIDNFLTFSRVERGQQRFPALGVGRVVAEFVVPHQAGDGHERVEVDRAGLLRTQEHKDEPRRDAVRRSQLDGLIESDEHDGLLGESVQVGVRHGDGVPEVEGAVLDR